MKSLESPMFFPLFRLAVLLFATLFAVPALCQTPLAPPVHARVISDPIGEMSGIVKSPGRDNLYWAHNDSGDSARIFALNGEGKSILPTYSKFTAYGDAPEDGKQQWQGFEVLYAGNVDWEDIAADDNYLYIGDTGNNGNARKDLAIYLISEIDPTASTRSAVIQKLPIAYPEQTRFPPRQWHFDSESLFTADGSVYLITKHRKGRGNEWEPGANLYRLDTRFSDKPNMLTRIDSHPTLTAATGADVSPDGQTLAVVSYEALWLFSRPAQGDLWLSAPARHYPFDNDVLRQVEAVTWMDNDTLLLSNEQRDLFKISVADLPSTSP
jgi:hypothetical protein